jgi:hypothetical protein
MVLQGFQSLNIHERDCRQLVDLRLVASYVDIWEKFLFALWCGGDRLKIPLDQLSSGVSMEQATSLGVDLSKGRLHDIEMSLAAKVTQGLNMRLQQERENPKKPFDGPDIWGVASYAGCKSGENYDAICFCLPIVLAKPPLIILSARVPLTSLVGMFEVAPETVIAAHQGDDRMAAMG